MQTINNRMTVINTSHMSCWLPHWDLSRTSLLNEWDPWRLYCYLKCIKKNIYLAPLAGLHKQNSNMWAIGDNLKLLKSSTLTLLQRWTSWDFIQAWPELDLVSDYAWPDNWKSVVCVRPCVNKDTGLCLKWYQLKQLCFNLTKCYKPYTEPLYSLHDNDTSFLSIRQPDRQKPLQRVRGVMIYCTGGRWTWGYSLQEGLCSGFSFSLSHIFHHQGPHKNSRMKTDRNIMWGWNESKLTSKIQIQFWLFPSERDSVYLLRKLCI